MHDTSLVDLGLDDLAREINQEHQFVCEAIQRALTHARRVGDLLIYVKDRLHHGEWLPWLNAHCDVSVRMAQNYMLLARRWSALVEAANAQRVAYLDLEDLSVRGALALLSSDAGEPEPEPLVEASKAFDDEFPLVEPAAFEYRCPRCRFGWRGNPLPQIGGEEG